MKNPRIYFSSSYTFFTVKRTLLAAALTTLFLLPTPLSANDSDASVSLGGIVLTRESRISMESERLTIALSKVTVEYEFLNESDRDITTEVAFPIPPYEFTEAAGGIRDFNDFKLWVDGQPRQYQTESKAIAWKRDAKDNKVGPQQDVTALLNRYGVDIATLAHFDDQSGSPDFSKLPAKAKKDLIQAGAFDGDARPMPLWEVHKTYHWTQTFPAHKILHVRHEYSPAFGFEGMEIEAFNEPSSDKFPNPQPPDGGTYAREEIQRLKDTCVTSAAQRSIFLQSSAALKADPNAGYIESEWVDYILTTANSWKTPIKRFDLIVARGPKRQMNGYYDDWDFASFCWDGPVKQINAHRFEASITNFVPKRDLKVLFLTLPMVNADLQPSSRMSNHSHRWWIVPGIVALLVVLLATFLKARRNIAPR